MGLRNRRKRYASDKNACIHERKVKKMRQSDLKKLSKFVKEPDNLALIQSYRDAGNDLNTMYKSTTPLCAASRGGKIEVVEYLINAGADPNVPDANCVTPLYIAASHGFDDILKLLLVNGANPDIPNMYGNSALMSAVTNGMDRASQILINAGASVNVSRPNTFGVDVSILSYVLFAKNDWAFADQLLIAGTLPHIFTPPLDFILLEDPQMPVSFLKKLMDAGFELYCKGWVRRMKKTFNELSERQQELLRLLLHNHSHPRSLQEISRIAIRVVVGKRSGTQQHFRDRIDTLPLPKCMKQFLALDK